MAIPLLETCEIAGGDLTADALLTQRKLVAYLRARGAHYHFTVKDNQKTLAEDIRTHFARRGEPNYTEPLHSAHGRIEQRRIGYTTALNDYLDFPHVGQTWLIERDRTHKKSGAYGLPITHIRAFRACWACQDKARRAAQGLFPCQAAQHRPGALSRLPAGEPLAGHLQRCALLQGRRPLLRGRALHLTGQRFAERPDVGNGQAYSRETVVGITSRTSEEMAPRQLLAINRGHWGIESLHYIIDWNYDEDRARIRSGHGPANVTRLRRFAIGLLKSFQQPGQHIPEMMRQLARRSRQVLDYLKLTANSAGVARSVG